MISVFIFTSNDFRPWKIEERERERERARRSHRSKMIAPLRSFKPTPSNPVIDHRDHLAISESHAKRETERERRESREIVAPSARSSRHRSRIRSHQIADEPTRTAPIALRQRTHHSDKWVFFHQIAPLMNFFLLGFVWKLRKCEEQEKNVFSILFSATQPNTRKYFPKHFLEYNQTLVNIFLSEK